MKGDASALKRNAMRHSGNLPSAALREGLFEGMPRILREVRFARMLSGCEP